MPGRQHTPDLWDEIRQQTRNRTIYDQVVSYAFEYLESIGEREVFPPTYALQRLAQFEEKLPEEPGDVPNILRLLHEAGSPATVAQGGGRYFGFVNGGLIPGSLAARWLADAWDQNAALHVISPIASKLEQLCEEWLVDLLTLPPGTAAGFVSGTSIATMCGLLAGRNILLDKLGWDANEQGVFGAPPIRIVMSEQAHGTVRKALAIIGIGRDNIEWVPADNQGRLNPDHLPALDERTLLILQAGNVNSGAFDPFVPLCREARQAGAWVHVDGAFGLWAAASQQTKSLARGIELADSWSVDAHKTLNAPYDSGIILCQDRAALVNAMQATGSYMQFSKDRDGMLFTPEMSRRARAIELWALLKTLGRRGVDDLVSRLCQNAKLFERELNKCDFNILNDVVFNQVLVACETPELTAKTLANIQTSGECWCGGSEWRGEPVIRISVCSWATTAEDVHRSVRAFVEARGLARQQEEA
ncbi:MAG: aspartate aminotransferase family protein [Chloroflexota bacterium]|nr:MAG: aspartate aminotransferase family protein [Chloroflexota bacterium]